MTIEEAQKIADIVNAVDDDYGIIGFVVNIAGMLNEAFPQWQWEADERGLRVHFRYG